LNEYPLYVKNGLDPAGAAGVPDNTDGSWLIKSPGSRRGAATIGSLGLPDMPQRFFLSPFKEKVREYTMAIPFIVNPEQFARLDEKTLQPGIFLASLGDNWEIWLNGSLIKSEIHLDEDGQIRSSRGWRYISLPLDRSSFISGTNILAFRIIGMPHAAITGMWYESPYYIDRYETIRKTHDESLVMISCGVYILVALYHFLIFLNRPQNRENLYHSIFSILLAVYFLMRTSAILRFIPNTNITFRLEYASLYLLVPLISVFLEHLNFGKTTKISRGFMKICLFLSAAQAIFSNPFGDDILSVWWVFALLGIGYIIGHDILYVFCRDIRARWKTSRNRSFPKVFLESLVRTPLGNIIIGTAILCATAAIDIISSIDKNYGIVDISRYGIFIFTMTTAVILTHRFGMTFRRLDEANLLLEQSKLNLEATVRERTRELERQTEVATPHPGQKAFSLPG
jgi:hypothetical protein